MVYYYDFNSFERLVGIYKLKDNMYFIIICIIQVQFKFLKFSNYNKGKIEM